MLSSLINIPDSWPCGDVCDVKFIPEFKISVDDKGLFTLTNDGRLLCVEPRLAKLKTVE